MITVYLLNTENISETDLKSLFGNSIADSPKRIVSYLCRKFLLTKLADILKTDINDNDIGITPNGKPYLKKASNIFFNISHTGNFAAVAIADCEIGVDIEHFRDVDISLCNRFFAIEENEYVKEDESLQTERFFEIWTKKEAYIKHNGLTLSSLSSFCVLNNGLKEKFFSAKTNDFYLSVYTETCEKTEIVNLSSSQLLFMLKK